MILIISIQEKVEDGSQTRGGKGTLPTPGDPRKDRQCLLLASAPTAGGPARGTKKRIHHAPRSGVALTFG